MEAYINNICSPSREVIKGKWVYPQDTRPSFAGQTVIVTGANAGIGFEASVKFVELGAAKVILAVRSLSRGEEAKKRIEERTGRSDIVEIWHLDMLDYSTIQQFAYRVDKELERLHIVILNAAITMIKFERSQYGYEKTLQVNTLSTALLGLLLMPKLRASKTPSFTPVLEIVSASGHAWVTKLRSETEPLASYNDPNNFSGLEQNSISKLCVQYVQKALAELSMNKENGRPDFYVTTICPGAVVSDMGRDKDEWWFAVFMFFLRVLFQRPTEAGARTYISGVTQGEKLHGRFWRDDMIRE